MPYNAIRNKVASITGFAQLGQLEVGRAFVILIIFSGRLNVRISISTTDAKPQR
jgi:hypothetical protein